MKSDEEIQRDVIDQIRWNPILNSSDIGVSVKNGVVTLFGQVDTYQKKIEAENDAKRIQGVKAIAEDIHVGISPSFMRTDSEIAEAAVNVLHWLSSVPHDQIHIRVEDGVVTLEGEVEWAYQRDAARKAVGALASVRDVISKIRLRNKATPEDLRDRIQNALQRSATIDAGNIDVEVSQEKATLKGHVRSISEKEDAEDAAWAAPGILLVDNQLHVSAERELSSYQLHG